MALNKKAQTGLFFLLMIGIVMFILAFALASPLIDTSNSARENLNCSNLSIQTYQKVTCGVVDIVSPWMIGLILGLGGMALGAKLVGI